MASPDRTLAICDLLLGAAHADSTFHERERERVRELLAELEGSKALAAEVEARIGAFSPAGFDLARAAAGFVGDSLEEKRALVRLIGAVHDADEELDLAEDDYLHELAAAIELPEEELSGLALDFEVEELRDGFTRLKNVPPPIPEAARARSEAAAPASVDVDIDD